MLLVCASESCWREADIGHVTIKIAGVTAAGGEWGLIRAHLIWWLTSCLYLGMMHAFNTNPGKMFIMFNRTLQAIFLVYNIYNRRLVGITLMYTFETQFIEVTYLVECDIALPGTNESRGQWACDTADQSESGARGEMEAEWCILLKSNVGKDQPSQGILGGERVGAIYINSYQFQALDVIFIWVTMKEYFLFLRNIVIFHRLWQCFSLKTASCVKGSL